MSRIHFKNGSRVPDITKNDCLASAIVFKGSKSETGMSGKPVQREENCLIFSGKKEAKQDWWEFPPMRIN